MKLRDCTVAIVGLGQMGASIGRVLVARRACRRVIGVSRKVSTLQAARRLMAAHEVTRDFDGACARADVVLLATPARTILRQIPAAACLMRPGTLLTDVGSTKGTILHLAAKACSLRGISFVGGHPMAGQSGSGPASSSSSLFCGHPYVLVPAPGTRPAALRLAAEIARTVGAIPIRLDADVHDRTVALVSHLPHAIAVVLMLLAAETRSRLPLRLAAGSFKSATRVAASDIDMLKDILLTNRPAICDAISKFTQLLRSFAKALLARDERLLAKQLSSARKFRLLLDTRL